MSGKAHTGHLLNVKQQERKNGTRNDGREAGSTVGNEFFEVTENGGFRPEEFE